ncbi:MAG: aldose 1-epimerase family protein [Actinomycetota bacterium]|nr:aldose 1-epimerase family protein [Actinomycetota bacterium]
MIAPSGVQYAIAFGDQRAVVAEVGATLRLYEARGEPVCWGFREEEMCSGSRGQVLAPWPNRLRDGSYEFEGAVGRVPLDEPERGNAIHGLVRWAPWRVVAHEAGAVRLDHVLHPQPAYPFALRLEIEYRLGGGGLAVTLRAEALGERRTPFGAGFHGYLELGPGGVDAARVALPASRRLLLDDRMLPRGVEDVRGSVHEVVCGTGPAASQPVVGALRLDDCFTGLEVGGDGRWHAELLSDGASGPVELWADAAYPYAMVYSGDTLVEPDRRKALAVEPMTCPPDALRTGEGLVVLEPGGSFAASYGVVPPRG